MMRFLVISLAILPSISLATDQFYANEISKISISSRLHNQNLEIPYLNKLSYETTLRDVKNSSGISIMGINNLAYSGYDSSISYDVSNFYKMSRPRVQSNLIVPGYSPGEYFTVGFDGGVSTQKLNITPGIFLGYTNTFYLKKDFLFNYGFGGWLGGKIKETPCYDSYDRVYACRTLTSWTDYNPTYPDQFKYISAKLLKYF